MPWLCPGSRKILAPPLDKWINKNFWIVVKFGHWQSICMALMLHGLMVSHVLTAIYRLSIKIVTSPLDSATPISWKRAIIWRQDNVFTLWPWPLTRDFERLYYIGCHVIKICTKFHRNRTIRVEVIDERFSTFSPALRHAWPLTPWPWTFAVDWVSRDQTLHQTWAELNNQRLSYSSFSLPPCRIRGGVVWNISESWFQLLSSHLELHYIWNDILW